MFLQWLSLVSTIWLQSINGSNCNFPAYSSQLKSLLSLSQLQLNNLASASDAGKLLGWVSGLAALYLPLWLVLAIGSVFGLLGYGLQYLFLIGHVVNLSYWHVFLLNMLAGNSICWINTVCYILTIHNFPYDQQLAVGISTSYVGLSAKIYTDIAKSVALFFPSDSARDYLLLNALLPLVVSLLVSPIVRKTKSEKSRCIQGGFVIMFVITIVTGTYSVISSFHTVKNKLSPLIFATLTGILLLCPLIVPIGEWTVEKLNKRCLIRSGKKIHNLYVEESGTTKNREGVKDIYEVCVKEEIGVKEMVRRVEFWLYVFVYLFGVTLGLVYMNNLGQIAESRGYDDTSSLVSIASAFGFFGRLVPSLMDYTFSRTDLMVSRPASIALMMAPISASFFLLLIPTTLSLYTSTAVLNLCTGSITSISVSLTTELFGKKNFSVNHNIIVANIPIGSFLFGDMAAILYRRHVGESGGRCMGMECYQTTFVIFGCLCFLGTIMAWVLHLNTKKFYSQRL